MWWKCLTEFKRKTGFDASAVKKAARVDGRWCRSTKRSDNTCHVLGMCDIKSALHFISKQRYFTVGSLVMKGRGGSSEPGTLVDLSEELRIIHQSRGALHNAGWLVGVLSLEETVTGVMQVDDTLVLSTIFCTACLERGMRKVWPPDVGISLEEVGPTVCMLQCHVHVPVIGDQVHARPYNPNVYFALGVAPD